MKKENLFKWKHYQPDMILLTVRWYLRYNLSFRDLVEMMEERGLSISHTTIMRWVHQYGPELDKRIRRHLKQTSDSWRVDETYIKVKGQWMYLYRAVDSKGNTIDFYLSKTRDQKAAKRFFKKALQSFHVSKPRDTATSILSGVEAMHMIKKEQVDLRDQSVQNQKEFIHQLFGLAA
ncbi:IS6 family transposase [Bacillus pseudomycoides]|uniref:IS6 family transposase n=1 Tax=Bacillus pseudomycoides TaxID=64104 RepID=A0A1Y3M5T0_9BACI|nr:IS6 family transposase [Bacillus pseudomycoides]OUM45787.1 IS6 family transposase [Bacillus pseudomycoides]